MFRAQCRSAKRGDQTVQIYWRAKRSEGKEKLDSQPGGLVQDEFRFSGHQEFAQVDCRLGNGSPGNGVGGARAAPAGRFGCCRVVTR
ncbi:hypothetical protein ACCAA_570079 [Candidatus Accumulibacter aalborgensis]|uniref:Uncharacterized protein n=1 Tax=Candidatus Accumulibacter aalborgensis TaxID=1860102 RepID=A0A1A8XUT2_9PROT|nr:hypothetical protein ACCAA_570079 [Candidatus Accumulibacter aalborgensis]